MNLQRVISSPLFALCCVVLLSVSAQAETFTFDTAPLAGTTYYVGFQLTDGNTANTTTVTLANFNFGGGAPGGSSTIIVEGGASGSLNAGTITLADTQFFNSFLQAFSAGNSFSFEATALSQVSIGATGSPDEFSFAILNTDFSEVATTDPSGANSLLRIIFDGDGSPTVLQYQLQATAVPEPATLLLLGLGLTGVAGRAASRSCEKRRAR